MQRKNGVEALHEKHEISWKKEVIHVKDKKRNQKLWKKKNAKKKSAKKNNKNKKAYSYVETMKNCFCTCRTCRAVEAWTVIMRWVPVEYLRPNFYGLV